MMNWDRSKLKYECLTWLDRLQRSKSAQIISNKEKESRNEPHCLELLFLKSEGSSNWRDRPQLRGQAERSAGLSRLGVRLDRFGHADAKLRIAKLRNALPHTGSVRAFCLLLIRSFPKREQTNLKMWQQVRFQARARSSRSVKYYSRKEIQLK